MKRARKRKDGGVRERDRGLWQRRSRTSDGVVRGPFPFTPLLLFLHSYKIGKKGGRLLTEY